MNKVLLVSLVSCAAALPWSARADDKPAKSEQGKPVPMKNVQENGQKHAFLGIGVQSISPAMSSQLRGVLPKGQGVLIAEVSKDSPAAKAGLRQNDILLSYGDQKLYSPEQLIKLVHDSMPRQEEKIDYVREGRAAQCAVKLGEHAVAMDAGERPFLQRFPADSRVRQFFEEFESNNVDSALESFDAIKLTRVDGKRWRAEVDFRAKDGKTEHKSFAGTREELRRDIMGEKDLPAAERSQLLHSLNLDRPWADLRFPLAAFGSNPVFSGDR
jgi:hypothetical protein